MTSTANKVAGQSSDLNSRARTLGSRPQVPTGNFIVLDFESTCSTEGGELIVPREFREIIEIGALVVNERLEVVDSFSHFVSPVRYPTLSKFCTELTTITQADVDSAESFPTVSTALAELAVKHEISWWGSWGKYDRNQLTQDVEFHSVTDPLPQPHFNLKADFSARQGIRRRLGLSGGLRFAHLQFEGTAHRAIDDTRNIVRLLPWILGDASADSAQNVPQSSIEEGVVP